MDPLIPPASGERSDGGGNAQGAGPVATARRWGPAVAVGVGILVGSLVDPGAVPGSPAGIAPDEVTHVVAYAGLAAALSHALAARGPTLRVLGGIVLAVGAFGGGVELLQATVPYRHPDPLDAAANAAGAVLGLAAWWAATAVRDRP